MMRTDGVHVSFHSDFAAFTDAAAADMSVLGRDLTKPIRRPQDVVCLLGGNHRYTISDN
jgi:hypothetical protein